MAVYHSHPLMMDELLHYLLPFREQRVTLFVTALLLGLSIMAYQVLRLLPMPVLYGIFLYIGVASLYGIQVWG